MIDLDDAPAATASINGQKGVQGDLASMFGLAPASSSQSSAPSSKPQKTAIDDILGLFDSSSGNTPIPPMNLTTPPTQPPAAPSSLFDATPPAATPPPPTMPTLTAYTAYDKHQLKITLTPQVSASKPGLVMILARFQVTGSAPASGLNFQAAVPKVCNFTYFILGDLL